MSRFVRASKYRYVTHATRMPCNMHCQLTIIKLTHVLNFRHVYGQVAKRELCIDNVKLTNSAWDTNLLAASGVSSLFSFTHSQLVTIIPNPPSSVTSVSTGMHLEEAPLPSYHFHLPLNPTASLQNSPMSSPLPEDTRLPY